MSQLPFQKLLSRKEIAKIIYSKDGFDVTKKAIDYLRPLILGEAFQNFSNGYLHQINLNFKWLKRS
ncbi:MAG: hypothetical protein Ct9H90mP22_0580 [Gammaproteobacteria bacterium]|nr:MAG: hypothetical protein Ct9H90mP22_0580 [Gammaproteobacteria bacterium]